MDINERYSQEDIQTVREFIDMTLETQGISQVMEVLKNAQNNKRYWEKYDKDREEELAATSKKDEEIEDDIIDIIMESFTGKKTEKMDEEKEKALREASEETQKILNIVLDDEKIKQNIAEYIYDLEYDENDDKSRMNTVRNVISTLSMIGNSSDNDKEKLKVLYDALNEKIDQMDVTDFIFVYENVIMQKFFSNPNFTRTILKKIDSMTNEEFEYFLLTTLDRMDGGKKEILDAKKIKAEKCNTPIIMELYTRTEVFSDQNKPDINYKYIMDKVQNLYTGTLDSKTALEVFESLNSSELMRFLIMHEGVSYHSTTRQLLSDDIIGPKLAKLSNDDIIVLTEIFNNKNGTYNSYMNGYKSSYESITNEAKRRNLLSNNYEKLYSEQDIYKTRKIYKFYKNLDKVRYFPSKILQFQTTVDEKNEDLDAESILLSRYNEQRKILKNNLELYSALEKTVGMSDLQILQEANRWNTRVKNSQISLDDKTGELQSYYFNFLKRKILSLPTRYAAFLQPIENGVLTDAMNVKIGEMQNYLRNKQQDENTNNTDTPNL